MTPLYYMRDQKHAPRLPLYPSIWEEVGAGLLFFLSVALAMLDLYLWSMPP
jgi:hypothetical protein